MFWYVLKEQHLRVGVRAKAATSACGRAEQLVAEGSGRFEGVVGGLHTLDLPVVLHIWGLATPRTSRNTLKIAQSSDMTPYL